MIVLFAAGCESTPPTDPAPASTVGFGSIRGELSLLRPAGSGSAIVVSVYVDVDQWAADHPLRRHTIRATDDQASFRFEALPIGAYAVDAWADQDGDGVFEQEDAAGVYGAETGPWFEPALVPVSGEGVEASIRLDLKPGRGFLEGFSGVPAEHLPAEPATECKTWSCIKCQFNPRCKGG